MRKRTLTILVLSTILAGCSLGKWENVPEKETTLNGYPMALRVLHEGPEFEIIATRAGRSGIFFPDFTQEKLLASTVADSEAATICGPKKVKLLVQEKWPDAPVWASRYRCD